VRGAVADFRRESVDLLLATTRLEVDKLHFRFETASLFFQVLVFKLLLFELMDCQRAGRVAERVKVRATMAERQR
jgi:hypothetical protein